MNKINNQRRITKLIFILLITEIYIMATVVQLGTNNENLKSFIVESLIFILITLVIFLSKELKVFTILFFTLLYGAGIYLGILMQINNSMYNITQYILLVLMPIIGITTFMLIIKIDELCIKAEEADRKKVLFTIDEVTGFENRGTLIKDLQREMVSSKRHKYPLSLMLVELQYANELKNLYNEDEINSIYLAIANTMNRLARIEDLKYRYDEHHFMLVIPFTDQKGVEIIKKRFKENLGSINIEMKTKGENLLKFQYKIAIKEYNEEIKEAIDFIKQVEKELEYDV